MAGVVGKSGRKGKATFGPPAPYEVVEAATGLQWTEKIGGRHSHYLEALQKLMDAPVGRFLRFEGQHDRIVPQVRKYARKLAIEVEFAQQGNFTFVREKSTQLQKELLQAVMAAQRTIAELTDAVKEKLPHVTGAEVKTALEQLANRGKVHRRDNLKWFAGRAPQAQNGGAK